jgi:hypothetical protein
MKTTKRFLTALMAMVMVCGSVISVSAATPVEPAVTNEGTVPNGGVEGEVTGAGANEGWVQTEIMRVVLPTDSLSYVVDAQGLVRKSYKTGAKGMQNYTDCTIVYSDKSATADITKATDEGGLDDGFVFFTKTDPKSQKKTLTNHIDLVLTNKGTYDVEVTPSLTFTPGTAPEGGVALKGAESNTAFTASDTANTVDNLRFKLYTKGADGAYGAVTSGTTKLPATNVKEYYTTTYDAKKGYSYTLDETKYSKATDLTNTATFTLEGFSNPYNVPENSKIAAGSIKVVWKVTKKTTT